MGERTMVWWTLSIRPKLSVTWCRLDSDSQDLREGWIEMGCHLVNEGKRTGMNGNEGMSCHRAFFLQSSVKEKEYDFSFHAGSLYLDFEKRLVQMGTRTNE